MLQQLGVPSVDDLGEFRSAPWELIEQQGHTPDPPAMLLEHFSASLNAVGLKGLREAYREILKRRELTLQNEPG